MLYKQYQHSPGNIIHKALLLYKKGVSSGSDVENSGLKSG